MAAACGQAPLGRGPRGAGVSGEEGRISQAHREATDRPVFREGRRQARFLKGLSAAVWRRASSDLRGGGQTSQGPPVGKRPGPGWGPGMWGKARCKTDSHGPNGREAGVKGCAPVFWLKPGGGGRKESRVHWGQAR